MRNSICKSKRLAECKKPKKSSPNIRNITQSHNNADIKIKATQSAANMAQTIPQIWHFCCKLWYIYNNFRPWRRGWWGIFSIYFLFFPFSSSYFGSIVLLLQHHVDTSFTLQTVCVIHGLRASWWTQQRNCCSCLPACQPVRSLRSMASSVNHILITVLFDVYSGCLRSIHIDALQ